MRINVSETAFGECESKAFNSGGMYWECIQRNKGYAGLGINESDKAVFEKEMENAIHHKRLLDKLLYSSPPAWNHAVMYVAHNDNAVEILRRVSGSDKDRCQTVVTQTIEEFTKLS